MASTADITSAPLYMLSLLVAAALAAVTVASSTSPSSASGVQEKMSIAA